MISIECICNIGIVVLPVGEFSFKYVGEKQFSENFGEMRSWICAVEVSEANIHYGWNDFKLPGVIWDR